MKEAPKERTRKLVALGGLVRLAGLEALPPAALLGALLHAVERYRKAPAEERERLRQSGELLLSRRQGEKRPAAPSGIGGNPWHI